MSKERDPASIGRFVTFVKFFYDVYCNFVVPGVIHLDGALKKRKRRKQKEQEKEENEDAPTKEHPHTTRLRREMERDKKKRESKRRKPEE